MPTFIQLQKNNAKNSQLNHELLLKKVRNCEEPQKGDERAHFGIQLLTAGSAACVSDLFTFPLDTLKVRLQIHGNGTPSNEGNVVRVRQPNMFQMFNKIVKTEGFRSLYNGLIPGLQRQMAFSAIRIGAYESVRDRYAKWMSCDSESQGYMLIRIMAGISTGALAIFIAQPTDVIKVRMQAYSPQNVCDGFCYKQGVFEAYKQLYLTEGMKGLYKGWIPNIWRTCIINVGEIVVYDSSKDYLVRYGLVEKDTTSCHLTSAIVAGFTSTLVASPVDVIKTRIMNSNTIAGEEVKMRKGDVGSGSGIVECATKIYKTDGVSGFYKGFSASFARLFAWNVVLWMTYEQMKKSI